MGCSELLLGAARSCSELLGAARSGSELLRTARTCFGVLEGYVSNDNKRAAGYAQQGSADEQVVVDMPTLPPVGSCEQHRAAPELVRAEGRGREQLSAQMRAAVSRIPIGDGVAGGPRLQRAQSLILGL